MTVPDFAVTAAVVLGFLTCALVLRILATGTPIRARVARRPRGASRAMMDE
ncbi:hypothetical protein [Nocardia thraciensis]